jgi:predicted AAA+ superfamily ATPase
MAMRYFYEQLPDIHLIAAGSLLELALGAHSFPVGRVEFQWLRPMGFEEFLWAAKHDTLADNLPDLDTNEPIPEFIHEKLMEQLRYYFLVGGMPEAIETFVETSSVVEVASIHKELCQSYLQDFMKYGDRIDRNCVIHIFEQMPRQVGEKIKYTALYPDKRIEKIKESLQLLELMLLIQKVSSSHAQGLPLGADASAKIFKAIFVDIGLMQFMCGISSFELLNKQDLLNIYRGALAEQFVGQELLLFGGSENERLHYWERPNKSSSAEVDYLLVRNGEIFPLEVKSGAPARLKSINLFLNERPRCKQGFVVYEGNIQSDPTYKLKYMPLYTRLITSRK